MSNSIKDFMMVPRAISGLDRLIYVKYNQSGRYHFLKVNKSKVSHASHPYKDCWTVDYEALPPTISGGNMEISIYEQVWEFIIRNRSKLSMFQRGQITKDELLDTITSISGFDTTPTSTQPSIQQSDISAQDVANNLMMMSLYA